MFDDVIVPLVMTSANILPILRNFVPEYLHAKFGGTWNANKGKTEGRCNLHCAPSSLYFTKIPQPE